MKFFFLCVIYFSTLTFGLNKNILEDEIKEHVNKYLFLKNSQKYCEKGDLILAQSTDKLFDLNKALNICESKKNCDYISYSPKRNLRNSIFYENDKPLKNTGANWFCSGKKWVSFKPRKYWIAAIKDSHIKDQMKNYNIIYLNKKGECDKENVVMKITKIITPQEAAEECDKISSCKYIIFNYNKKLGNNQEVTEKAILCSQPPKNRISNLGFLIAGKYNEMNPKTEKKKHRTKKKISVNTSMGGSIALDDHYHFYNKGDVVNAEKI